MAKDNKSKAAEFEGKEVKPNQLVEITWIGSDKFHPKGSKSFVHPLQAAKLSDKGLAEITGNPKGGKPVVQTEA